MKEEIIESLKNLYPDDKYVKSHRLHPEGHANYGTHFTYLVTTNERIIKMNLAINKHYNSYAIGVIDFFNSREVVFYHSKPDTNHYLDDAGSSRPLEKFPNCFFLNVDYQNSNINSLFFFGRTISYLKIISEIINLYKQYIIAQNPNVTYNEVNLVQLDDIRSLSESPNNVPLIYRNEKGNLIVNVFEIKDSIINRSFNE